MTNTEERDLAHRHLKEAEEVVALGRVHVANQVRIFAEIRKDGHDISAAEELLKTLQNSQALHEEHRDRLWREPGSA